MINSNGERTDLLYWESQWSDEETPRSCHFVVNTRDLRHFANRKFHHLFSSLLNERKGQRLIEIGCGGSSWLPYFASYFDMEITGIDYSPTGCCRAKKILKDLNIQGAIVEANLFRPPSEMLNAFDILVSFGVVEHFLDPSVCICACREFLRDGGLMITVIPNLTGLAGRIQKCIYPAVLNLHTLMEKKDLFEAHRSAGLRVLWCDYFMFLNLSVINIELWKRSHPFLGKIMCQILRGLTGGIWAIESMLPFSLSSNRCTSPHIVCVAQKRVLP